MHVFETASARRFENALFTRLEEKFPEEFSHLSNPGAQALMERSIERATRLGLAREGHIAVFVELVFEFGEGWERSSQAAAAVSLLGNKSLPGPAKLQGIHDLLRSSTEGRTLRVYR